MTHVGYTNAKTKINPSITANNLWKLTYFLHSLCDYNELLSPDLILVSMEGAMHLGNSLPGTSSLIQISFFGSVLHGKTHRHTSLHGCQWCRETPQAQILHQHESDRVWLFSRRDMMTYTDWDPVELKQPALIKSRKRRLLTHSLTQRCREEGLTWGKKASSLHLGETGQWLSI